ncbi:unnamed protein product [Fraxinus pennsylvanica]|uniref:F-box domain-containing protein n=1 Tax=Fraxinus pennsylvanica TaxID=56036 RepID=A0AAD2DRR0_9LAMI|nr:unnamed protein product [Fraxinus pennsylvanica]
MEDLPPQLLLEILSRLRDSEDLARYRVASKTLNSIARDIRSVNLQCSYDRYAKSRSPLTSSSITPFKEIFIKLISELEIVESVSMGVEKPLRYGAYDDMENEEADLYLSDLLKRYLTNAKVCGGLKSISISDFWVQSCWRRSDVLSLISSHCLNLSELDVKNAWLSVDGLNPMPKLTNLTLEFIILDDEDLNKINESFPSLQVLNLIGVGGLKEPRIHLMHLKTCQCIVFNAPNSLAIIAPNLVKLTLICVKPKPLVIETPLLSDLHFSVETAGNFKVKGLHDLRRLHLESTDLRNLLVTFPFGKTVRNLTVVSKEFETYPGQDGLESRLQMKGLKKITAYLTANDFEMTISTIFSILENCTKLSDMALLIHRDVVSNGTNSLISRCNGNGDCGKTKQKMHGYLIVFSDFEFAACSISVKPPFQVDLR